MRPDTQHAPTQSTAARAALGLLALLLSLFVLAPAANASKQAIDFFGGSGAEGGKFGTNMAGVAVNNSGAGPANAGDVYALDPEHNRVERFGRDDNGTPANTGDDTYFFISTWGAAAGNGSLSLSSGDHVTPAIALDQDTGELYVSDNENNRINVYTGDGAFLRSFGYDVVQSGPDDNGTGYEVCIAANGDVCKAGLRGSGAGQAGTLTEHSGAEGIAVSAPDGNPATGTVFLADAGNRRVDTYSLDGSSPSSFGSTAQFPFDPVLGSFTHVQPTAVAVDSRGIVYIGAGGVSTLEGNGDFQIERYDSQNANGGGVGFLAPIRSPQREIQILAEEATAGTFRLTFGGKTTTDLPYNAGVEEVRAALEALSSVGAGNVIVQQFRKENLAGEAIELRIVEFRNALDETDLEQLTVSNGTTPLTSSIPVVTEFNGHPGLAPKKPVRALAVDPDEDGAGPETDVLYAEREKAIQQFGPLNSPGLTAPPSAVDDTHGTSALQGVVSGLAIEPSTGRLYAASSNGQAGPGVYVLDNASPTPPTGTLDSIDNVTAKSADLHATIDPNGPPTTRYHFEYSTDGSNWTSLPEVLLGTQEAPQAITEHLEPLPIGLEAKTTYHVRLVFGRKFATPTTTSELTFTTNPSPPLAETDGAPVRTTTTAQLNGRVTPLGTATTYHFEYGIDESYGQNTPSMPAGSGQQAELAGEEIEGLTPDTTYHYRLVASNGVGSPVMGADMTVHTRASDALPNQDDKFPGPPGSDRAWEQVSIAESSGSPVSLFAPFAFSDDGNRAVYSIAGGTPISSSGNFLSSYFAERTPSGWQTSLISPPRDQLVGSAWIFLYGPDDLSRVVSVDVGNDSGAEEKEIWRMGPGLSPALLLRAAPSAVQINHLGTSADGSRTVAALQSGNPLDPAYPAAAEQENLYDVSSASPHLVSLLPGNLVSPCGAHLGGGVDIPGSNWISADGSLVYFESSPSKPCAGSGNAGSQLYVREVEAAQTKLISGPPLSGPDCGGSFIKGIPGVAFFATSSRLDPADSEPASCAGPDNDVYRYDLSDGSLKCITCVIPGFGVGVEGTDPSHIAVSDDGSRVYFTSQKRLVPGAPPDGQSAIYRVDVQSGDLAYVAPSSDSIGTASSAAEIDAEGSALVFSSSLTFLNPLGGAADNAGTTQYYRYSDTDGSLVCATCPQDGSAPAGQLAAGGLHRPGTSVGANQRALSADGQTFAFITPSRLVGADQNTPGPGHNVASGTDVYEWRDGRQLLVTDGLSNWPESPIGVARPDLQGISPSGRDVYFAATAAYTPDAPDALLRLYDARIGGGISFPQPPPPCPLEVCQGTPRGAPEEQEPASRNFQGLGNPAPESKGRKCPKGKRKVKSRGKVRCVAPRKPNHHRANRNRRASR